MRNLKETHIVVVTNNKGGVGKTTITYGLAQALSKRNKKILLIDSDPQGSLSRRCGYEPKEYTDKSLYDCLENILRKKNKLISDYIQPTDNAYVDILTGDTRLNINRNEVAMVFMRANFVYKSILNSARQLNKYDFILIDTSPSVGAEYTQILVGSDYVLIPITTSRDSIEGIDSVVSSYNDCQAFNPGLKLLGIIFNDVSLRGAIAKDIIPEIKETYKEYVFSTVIERSVIVEKFEWNNSLGSEANKINAAFHSLAKEVLKRIG